ncbi:uncharacterized protein F4807DRAFT_421842 [Annulohypoxylon truncatum]|uniref:uncharacterized protein n=1 Tax=Annulohypoxylon truncatum TaxID=327061 RepID=UPI00200822FA|nr:uncharacterized protein F4807DRAFT_421842 [Annulohypoxylon truncatum]KAI1210550.1 hypothetical protein F4807DRAFT_421842 [Annulohypoxylon truncatum]
MLTKTAFLAAALSATASAQMRAPILARETRTLVTASEPESTESTSPECASRIESWTAAFPTPAPALEDALDNADDSESGVGAEGIDGLCGFASDLPSSAKAAFTSYNLDMYSYLSAQSSNLLAIATSCSADMGADPSVITSELDELLTVYSSFSAGACADVATTGPASSSATQTGTTSAVSSSGSSAAATSTSSSSGSSASGSASSSGTASASSSSTVSQNAGPRETGMFTAAALAMGVLGAAVVL